MSRNRSWGLSAKGKEVSEKGELQGTFVYIVSPGYLRAMGMRLVSGRDISWDDGPKSAKVVIVNETVARHLWPGEDPDRPHRAGDGHPRPGDWRHRRRS